MSKTLHRVELRATHARDLPFVLAAEAAPHASPFVIRWDEAQHASALADSDLAHYIVTAPGDHGAVGFVLLAGLRRDDHVIELRRIVIATPGRGLGRAALRCVRRLAFDSLGCRRLWLDVKPENVRARELYASEGFREDGTLTDALIIMSLSRDAGREGPPPVA